MKVREDFPRGVSDSDLDTEIVRLTKELSIHAEQAPYHTPATTLLVHLAIAEREFRRALVSRRSSFLPPDAEVVP
jgi:hypothetical protein